MGHHETVSSTLVQNKTKLLFNYVKRP